MADCVYGESGKRTTARTLERFFDQIAPIEDLQASIDLVSVLAKSMLDDVTVTSFLTFISGDLQQLVDPDEILNASDWPTIAERLMTLFIDPAGNRRLDRISLVCTRLFLTLTSNGFVPTPERSANLVNFMLLEVIPNDLCFSLHRDLVSKGPRFADMLRNPELAKRLVGSL